jgi:hypothetical protein
VTTRAHPRPHTTSSRRAASLALAALLASFALPAASGAGQVLVVGPDVVPGVEFTNPQTAIDAASEGDFVLVRAGSYDVAVVIAGKGIVLSGATGDGGERPTFASLEIRDTATSQQVIVRGIVSSDWNPIGSVGPRIAIRDCDGAVVLEDCAGEQVVDLPNFPSGPGVVVERSSRVVFARCTGRGSKGRIPIAFDPEAPPIAGISPGAGLDVVDSTVAVFGGAWIGGAGSSAAATGFGFAKAQVGAPGVRFSSGSMQLAGTVVTGGAGGAGVDDFAFCSGPASGGPGILDSGSLILRDTQAVGGAAGSPVACAPAAAASLPLEVAGGSVATYGEPVRRLAIESPGAEGQTITIAVSGVPGEPLALLRSSAASPLFVPALRGTLVPALPLQILALGNLPGTGELAFDVTLPQGIFPPSLEAAILVHQVISPALAGGAALGEPSVLLLLDA